LTTDRKGFVAGLIAGDPDLSAGELARTVRQHFGKGLNVMDMRKLKAAFLAGSFDRLWDEMFANEADIERSEAGLKRAKKSRGERRRKTLIKGRRDIDRDKIVLRDFAVHLVVYRTNDGFVHSQGFDSRKRAEALVQELLDEGIAAADVAYFKRVEAELAMAA
jgi:hypothetical protein